VCDGVLAGLVSWGGDDKACTIKNMPYVFARVSLALDWIREIVGA
jgi:secreted trypsin-like serine protease